MSLEKYSAYRMSQGILKESNLLYEWSLESVCLRDYF
jgi:hypothetical protein